MSRHLPLHCPHCQRYLGASAGYLDAPPCQCGWKTVRTEDGTLDTRYVKRDGKPRSFRDEVVDKVVMAP